MHGNVALPQQDQFKYLDVLVDKHVNLKVSKEHAAQPYMAAQRGYISVKITATNLPVLRVCGQEPSQFYWFRATVKLSNSMLEPNSQTLRPVLKADLHLADRNESCWSAHVSKAFIGMYNEDMLKREC
eukprot:1146837-Pelagomonas_calceolata.AAC.1